MIISKQRLRVMVCLCLSLPSDFLFIFSVTLLLFSLDFFLVSGDTSGRHTANYSPSHWSKHKHRTSPERGTGMNRGIQKLVITIRSTLLQAQNFSPSNLFLYSRGDYLPRSHILSLTTSNHCRASNSRTRASLDITHRRQAEALESGKRLLLLRHCAQTLHTRRVAADRMWN